MADPFLSQITGFGLNFAVRAWSFCNGQLIAINTNDALFSLLGTIYGGDGRTTFALPDLRGRIPLQHGHGPGLPEYRIGQKGGAVSFTQTTNHMASHNHGSGTLGVAAVPASVIAPASDTVVAVPVAPSGNVTAFAPVASQNATISAQGGSTQDAGGSQSQSIQNPYLAISFEIAMFGVYPSRN